MRQRPARRGSSEPPRAAGATRIRVAVLDGPVDFSHSVFLGADLRQVTTAACVRSGSAGPAARHGTHVASLIFGQPGSSVVGAAPTATGLIIPIFADASPAGIVPVSHSDLADAIDQALGHRAHVINISGGQLSSSPRVEPVLERALRRCEEAGVLVVVAAGNDGCNCFHVPAAEATTLVVGAMDARDHPSGFSNWGEPYRDHGLLAPGEDILGARPGGGTIRLSGTSFAAARVSGVAARLLSGMAARGQDADARVVRRALLEAAVACDRLPTVNCERLLAGRLDAVEAGRRLLAGAAPPAPGEPSPHERRAIAARSEPVAVTPSQVPASSPTVDDPGRSAAADSGRSRRPPDPQPELVYVLGALGHDLGSQAVRDSFEQQGVSDPGDPARLLAYLEDRPWAAEAVSWVLMQGATPIYVVRGAGPFAHRTYFHLRHLFERQLRGEIEVVALAGRVGGAVRLSTGREVPILYLDPRGVSGWERSRWAQAALDTEMDRGLEEDLVSFWQRIAFELRNRGSDPGHRAMNFVVTRALAVGEVFRDARERRIQLGRVAVETVTLPLPRGDFWDVTLTFFDPADRDHAQRIYRYRVDVSEEIPALRGDLRSWDVVSPNYRHRAG